MSDGAAPTFDIRIVIALGETTTVSCLDRDDVGIRRDAAGEHHHDRDGSTEDVPAQYRVRASPAEPVLLVTFAA